MMVLLALSLAGVVTAATAYSAVPPVTADPAQTALAPELARPASISEPVRGELLPPCTSATGVKPARELCRAVPGRRAVPQIIERMPVQPPPHVHGVQPSPAAPSSLAPSAVPSALRPLTGCVAGACRDAAGVLYNGGVGNATLDPNGRLCNRDGAWLQCF